MRAARVSTSTMMAAAAGLIGGCVSHPIPRPVWTRFGNTSTATGGPAYHRNIHHQYFDRSANRYYYYDPARKGFFWENGEPRS